MPSWKNGNLISANSPGCLDRALSVFMSESPETIPASPGPAPLLQEMGAPFLPASRRIHDMPQDERPREKMERQGAGALSDAELLALFFRTGLPGLSAIDIGRLLLKQYGSLANLSRQSTSEIQKQKGLGPAKAMDLAAAFELGKRLARQGAVSQRVDNPQAVVELLGPELRAEPLEVLKAVLLTTRGTLIAVEEISRGGLTETIAHPREVMRAAISRSAFSFILVHNHPSGDPTPSAADIAMTRRIRDAAVTMQIQFHDHIIIGAPSEARPGGYHSFRETGMM
jgi:DNA repair protein RadC